MDIVQLSWQAKVVQPLQGKGYLDNEREMRIFLPRPALIALGRMQMSVQLYLEVKQDLIRPRSAEGSSAKLPVSQAVHEGPGATWCSPAIGWGRAVRLLPSPGTPPSHS